MNIKYLYFIIIYLIILYILPKGFCKLYPAIYTNYKEADIVKKIYDTRTKEDIEFFKYTDKEYNKIFEDLFKKYNLDHLEINKVARSFVIYGYLGLHKLYFNRARPYEINKDIIPPENTKTYFSPAFPSGHAFISLFLAKHFGDKYPQIKEEIYKIAYSICAVRIKLGVHYPEDIRFAKCLVDRDYKWLITLINL